MAPRRDLTDLGRLIDAGMRRRRVNQKQLAALMAVSQSTVGRWLSTTHVPARDTLTAVAAELGLDEDRVLHAAGYPVRRDPARVVLAPVLRALAELLHPEFGMHAYWRAQLTTLLEHVVQVYEQLNLTQETLEVAASREAMEQSGESAEDHTAGRPPPE